MGDHEDTARILELELGQVESGRGPAHPDPRLPPIG
jgi:hypothetical protein